LVPGALEAAFEGSHETGVLVGDDQPHPREATAFSAVRKPRQNTSSSLSPTSSPRTSRPPSVVMPVATTTAIDTTCEVLLRTCR
jgi:hypothetical protein